MPISYCPSGHKVSYSGVKPAKCPSCNGPMEVKPIHIPAAGPVKTAAKPGTYSWASETEEVIHAIEQGDFGGMDISISKGEFDGKLPTIKDVRENGAVGGVDLREANGPGSNRGVSAASLVAEMLKS